MMIFGNKKTCKLELAGFEIVLLKKGNMII
jgi:hypothetical protein